MRFRKPKPRLVFFRYTLVNISMANGKKSVKRPGSSPCAPAGSGIVRPLVVLFLLASSPAANAAAAEIHVSAAASLTDALRVVARAWEVKSGDTIRFNFAASSTLARQIAEGAPADLFISADEEKMDQLQKQELISIDTRCTLLSNTLVIAVPADETVSITSPRDLASRAVRRIAMAEPGSVPAGIYARRYLQKIGVWNRIRDRIVPTENVRATLSAVESGNVDAGIVYRTDALISRKIKVAVEIGRKEGPVISYPFAVLKAASEPAAARRFLDYLSSPAALEIFARYGFLTNPPC